MHSIGEMIFRGPALAEIRTTWPSLPRLEGRRRPDGQTWVIVGRRGELRGEMWASGLPFDPEGVCYDLICSFDSGSRWAYVRATPIFEIDPTRPPEVWRLWDLSDRSDMWTVSGARVSRLLKRIERAAA